VAASAVSAAPPFRFTVPAHGPLNITRTGFSVSFHFPTEDDGIAFFDAVSAVRGQPSWREIEDFTRGRVPLETPPEVKAGE